MRALINRFEACCKTLRRTVLQWQGAQLGTNCIIESQAAINLGIYQGKPGSLKLASHVTLSRGVLLDCWGGEISIEENVFIGPYSVIYGHGGVSIGENSLIAMHCCIVSANHSIPNQSTSIRHCEDIRSAIKIGSDVWLAAGVKVMPGVTIGNGCVVGAGAVVTKDLPDFAIAYGVPARVVGQRKEQ